MPFSFISDVTTGWVHDTDSIIFSVKDGEYVPPLGTYLGQLTDELTCKEMGCRKQGCSGH